MKPKKAGLLGLLGLTALMSLSTSAGCGPISSEDSLSSSSANTQALALPDRDIVPVQEWLSTATNLSQSNQLSSWYDMGNDGKPFTVSFWLKLRSTSSQWVSVVSFGDNNSERLPGIFIFPDSRKVHVSISDADGDNKTVSADANLTLDSWTHVALVYKSYNLVLYLDGVAHGSVDIAKGRAGGSCAVYASSPWYLAADAKVRYLRHRLAALSTTEITQEMANDGL